MATKAKKGAKAAAPATPVAPPTATLAEIEDLLGRHTGAIAEHLTTLNGRLPVKPSPIVRLLLDDGPSPYDGYGSRDERRILPGIALPVDDNGIIKLTADDCRRLARMTAARKLPDGLTPRLLGRDAAAAYLGISPNHFDRHVAQSVVPIAIGDRRLWDIRALDRWLDGQSGLTHAPQPKQKWLEALDGDQNEGRKAGRL